MKDPFLRIFNEKKCKKYFIIRQDKLSLRLSDSPNYITDVLLIVSVWIDIRSVLFNLSGLVRINVARYFLEKKISPLSLFHPKKLVIIQNLSEFRVHVNKQIVVPFVNGSHHFPENLSFG